MTSEDNYKVSIRARDSFRGPTFIVKLDKGQRQRH